MPKGIYAAASAMVTESRALDVAAHNLANVQTSGFRRGTLIRGDFAATLAREGRNGGIVADGGAGVFARSVHHSFIEGDRDQTNAPFDLALQNSPPHPDGDGVIKPPQAAFFRVAAPDGRHYLTRAGHFTVDDSGRLVTGEGFPVEGQGGEIAIPPDVSDVTVDQAGRVWSRSSSGGADTFIDQIRVVTVDQPDRMRAVSGQYFDPADAPIEDAKGAIVHQGFIERSNVDPIRELVSLITIQRRYDAAQRAMSQQDQTGQRNGDFLRGGA